MAKWTKDFTAGEETANFFASEVMKAMFVVFGEVLECAGVFHVRGMRVNDVWVFGLEFGVSGRHVCK